jgi:integrase
MATMGRRRKNDDGLPPRLYFNHGAFFYVHRDGRWESMGKDRDTAIRRAEIINDPKGRYGTMVYWLDAFILECARRVALSKAAPRDVRLSPRTLEDYQDAVGTDDKPSAMRIFFGSGLAPGDVKPSLVQEFLRVNAEAGRARRANMDRACLSSCFGWLLRENKVPGLMVNPCLRASGVQRNPEKKRDLYVEDDWFNEVYALAVPSVRLLMELTYRTLQRPESDIIHWDTRVLATEGGQRLLRFTQNKTGKELRVALSPHLDALVRASLGDVPKLQQHLIRDRNGDAYSYDGLAAMLRRYIAKANEARKKDGRLPMDSWGFRDLKGKGATDMWRAGVPLEKIQLLCGHENKETTEKYVKARWAQVAQPNSVSIA